MPSIVMALSPLLKVKPVHTVELPVLFYTLSLQSAAVFLFLAWYTLEYLMRTGQLVKLCFFNMISQLEFCSNFLLLLDMLD